MLTQMMVGFEVNNFSHFRLTYRHAGLKILSSASAKSYFLIYIAIGPDLPVDCGFGSMVTAPDGFGIILLGCQKTMHRTDPGPDANKTAEIGSQIIYQLTWNGGDSLQWSEMEQLLKYPRYNTLAMFIPDKHCGMYLPYLFSYLPLTIPWQGIYSK